MNVCNNSQGNDYHLCLPLICQDCTRLSKISLGRVLDALNEGKLEVLALSQLKSVISNLSKGLQVRDNLAVLLMQLHTDLVLYKRV